MNLRKWTFGLVLVIAIVSRSDHLHGQTGTLGGEWRTYGGDGANTRYAALDQVTASNFNKLEIAWEFKTDFLGPRPEFNFQATPLMVNGVLYSTAGTRRAAVAVDATTGELLWMHSEQEGPRADNAPRKLSGRGLAYWSDGKDARILYVTPGYQLVALSARTGARIPTFGNDGIVDLKQDDDQVMDLVHSDIGLHATPMIAKDVVIIGAAHSASVAPKGKTNVKGYVRGFDVRTGRRIWTFHTIPNPGEFGNDTWEKDSWSYTGNAGVWAQMSVDEELGLAYLPVELPTGDYYGGHRPGDNLFGESIVAIDFKTGRRRWHYQLVHHGIWDMDIPCAPILVDITVEGRPIKALAQPTKQGWVYVLNRVTGVPVWPIPERPVPQSTVPGEKTSRTQPFVTKPPPFERQGITADDLIDFTPELKAEAVALMSRYKIGPLFTPAVVSDWNGPLATLTLPSGTGGANWPGGAFDPETRMLYVYSHTAATTAGLTPTKEPIDFAYWSGIAKNPSESGGESGAGAEGGFRITVQGLPLVKPPYGRITALNLDRGELVWQVAHGDTPDYIKNHPALKGLDIPRTGREGRIGVLVTKTLVIAGEAGFNTTSPGGKRGAMLRAYDKATGQEVGAVFLPAPQTGSPMTFMSGGRQYITLAIGGPGFSGELITYRLPR